MKSKTDLKTKTSLKSSTLKSGKEDKISPMPIPQVKDTSKSKIDYIPELERGDDTATGGEF